MGLVKMKEEVIKEWEDLNGIYPYVRATLYVYCDCCGSFDIFRPFSLPLALMVSGVSLLLGVVIVTIFPEVNQLLLLVLPASSFAIMYVLQHHLVCRQCGKRPTLKRNTLNYPSGAKIDVHVGEVQQLYVEYFPHQIHWEAVSKSSGMFSITDPISGVIEGSAGMILFILSIPIFLFFPFVYLALLVLYLLWNIISTVGKK